MKKFAKVAIVMVLFCVSIVLLLLGGGTDWKCFLALITAIGCGAYGAKTNFGTV